MESEKGGVYWCYYILSLDYFEKWVPTEGQLGGWYFLCFFFNFFIRNKGWEVRKGNSF